MFNSITRDLKFFYDIFSHSSLKSICWLSLTLVVVLISVACNIYSPYLLKTVIDNLVIEPGITSSVAIAFITYGVVLALGKLIIELKFIPYSLWENSILPKLYTFLYDKTIKSKFEYFNKNNVGTLAAKINMSVLGFKNFCCDCIFFFFPLAIELIFMSYSIYIVLNDLLVASIMLIGFSIYAILVILFSYELTRHQNISRSSGLDLIKILSDMFLCWKDIKLCSGFSVTQNMVEKSSQIYAKKIHGVYTKRVFVGVCQVTVLIITIITINYINIKNMVNGRISVGGIILVNGYIYQIMRPLEALSMNYRNMIRFFNDFILLMRELSDANPQGSKNKMPQDISCIKLENVSKPGFLKNFNLQFKKGESVAIIGKSGAGKTTLLNIIANIDKDYQGNVYYDNKNISTIASMDDNNIAIAYLTADAKLLLQSPYVNVMLSDSSIERELVGCLNTVNLDEEKLNDICGKFENCQTLSSGEKQRLLIARTLLMNKPVRIFDESLSAIDYQTQAIITDNILKDGKKYINIFVTHNESLASKFDKVIRVVDGNVIEEKAALRQELAIAGEL